MQSFRVIFIAIWSACCLGWLAGCTAPPGFEEKALEAIADDSTLEENKAVEQAAFGHKGASSPDPITPDLIIASVEKATANDEKVATNDNDNQMVEKSLASTTSSSDNNNLADVMNDSKVVLSDKPSSLPVLDTTTITSTPTPDSIRDNQGNSENVPEVASSYPDEFRRPKTHYTYDPTGECKVGDYSPDPTGPSVGDLITEEFTQPEPKKLDILWVVDNSGSMQEEQDNLANNFRSFVTHLKDRDIDFQLAVTSTDICGDQPNSYCPDWIFMGNYYHPGYQPLRGTFQGTWGNTVLKSDQANLEEIFMANVTLGTVGSGAEHGLTAAQLAIEKSLISNTKNSGFMREDSFLAVIVVSDEEDSGLKLHAQGYTNYLYSDTDFIEFLKTHKKEGEFSVSSIVGTIDPQTGKVCQTPEGTPVEEGKQYIKATEKTGGLTASICDQDFAKSLQALGGDLSSQVSQVVLTAKPFPFTLRVYVDDVEYTDYVDYIESQNAVRFHPDRLPTPGKQIKITFFEQKENPLDGQYAEFTPEQHPYCDEEAAPEATPECLDDSFQQPAEEIVRKIDILFVADTSGSLRAEREAVADGIDNFISEIGSEVDFQVAVMLAHGSTSGWTGSLYQKNNESIVLSGNDLSMNKLRSDLQKKLIDAASDSDGDGGELGLYSLHRGLSGANLAHIRGNGFFREDAALAVVFISDENDICAEYPAGINPVYDYEGKEGPAFQRDCSGINPASVLAELKTLQGDNPLLVSSIIYTNPNTVPQTGENEVGYGYKELVELAGGINIDLAEGNIPEGLSAIGQLASKKINLITEYSFDDQQIDPSSITVLVDGQEQSFNFIEGTNSLHLEEPGEPLSSIEIQYCKAI